MVNKYYGKKLDDKPTFYGPTSGQNPVIKEQTNFITAFVARVKDNYATKSNNPFSSLPKPSHDPFNFSRKQPEDPLKSESFKISAPQKAANSKQKSAKPKHDYLGTKIILFGLAATIGFGAYAYKSDIASEARNVFSHMKPTVTEIAKKQPAQKTAPKISIGDCKLTHCAIVLESTQKALDKVNVRITALSGYLKIAPANTPNLDVMQDKLQALSNAKDALENLIESARSGYIDNSDLSDRESLVSSFLSSAAKDNYALFSAAGYTRMHSPSDLDPLQPEMQDLQTVLINENSALKAILRDVKSRESILPYEKFLNESDLADASSKVVFSSRDITGEQPVNVMSTNIANLQQQNSSLEKQIKKVVAKKQAEYRRTFGYDSNNY